MWRKIIFVFTIIKSTHLIINVCRIWELTKYLWTTAVCPPYWRTAMSTMPLLDGSWVHEGFGNPYPDWFKDRMAETIQQSKTIERRHQLLTRPNILVKILFSLVNSGFIKEIFISSVRHQTWYKPAGEGRWLRNVLSACWRDEEPSAVWNISHFPDKMDGEIIIFYLVFISLKTF